MPNIVTSWFLGRKSRDCSLNRVKARFTKDPLRDAVSFRLPGLLPAAAVVGSSRQACPMARLSRAASTTALVTSRSELTSRIRSICVRRRFSNREVTAHDADDRRDRSIARFRNFPSGPPTRPYSKSMPDNVESDTKHRKRSPRLLYPVDPAFVCVLVAARHEPGDAANNPARTATGARRGLRHSAFCNCRRIHALAIFNSRFTVEADTPRTSAASAAFRPPK